MKITLAVLLLINAIIAKSNQNDENNNATLNETRREGFLQAYEERNNLNVIESKVGIRKKIKREAFLEAFLLI